eukprot:421935-Amphidinium_carterae.2
MTSLETPSQQSLQAPASASGDSASCSKTSNRTGVLREGTQRGEIRCLPGLPCMHSDRAGG